VLGLKLGVLLVLTVLVSVTVSFANADGILVEFDKSEYRTGDSLTITGQIAEMKMPVIAMSVYDPNGTILSANNVEIESDGLFSKTLYLDSPFYETSGEYKIKLNYGKISQTEFFTILNDVVTPEIIEPLVIPEITTLTTEKQTYTDNDTIVISGTVSTMDSPTVLIGIYDTFGGPAGFYFGQVTPDLKFSTNFLAKSGVNFKVDGTYSIKAHYAESSKTILFDFVSVKEEPVKEEPVKEEPVKEEPVKEEPVKEEPVKEEPVKEEPFNDNTNNSSTETNLNQNDSASTKTNNIVENISPNKSQEKKSSDNQSVIKNISDENISTENSNNDSLIGNISPTHKKPSKQSDEIKNDDNLSVEDIELGLMLNQINLKCDTSKYTDTITYYDGMGPALYRLCKFDSSLGFFQNSLVSDPKNVEILTNKASTLGKLGRISEAILYYDQVLDINPGFLPALNNKANALASLGRYDEAKSLYESAIEINPDYLTARKNLSILNSEYFETHSLPVTSHSIQQIDYQYENNITDNETLTNTKQPEPQKDVPANFFEEVSMVFSSLFGFLN